MSHATAKYTSTLYLDTLFAELALFFVQIKIPAQSNRNLHFLQIYNTLVTYWVYRKCCGQLWRVLINGYLVSVGYAYQMNMAAI